MEKLKAIVKKDEQVLGYCVEEYGIKSFEEKTKAENRNVPVIELSSTINFDTKTPIREIFKNIPIGTPLKIKGCCEGMNNQQLVYVGKFTDELGTTWYMFYDGYCNPHRDEFPEPFGYALKQLEYKDVFVSFDNIEVEKVDKMHKEYSYLCAVANYVA